MMITYSFNYGPIIIFPVASIFINSSYYLLKERIKKKHGCIFCAFSLSQFELIKQINIYNSYLSSIQIANMNLIYQAVRIYSRRGGDVVKRLMGIMLYQPAGRPNLLEQAKNQCNIQVIVYRFTVANKKYFYIISPQPPSPFPPLLTHPSSIT